MNQREWLKRGQELVRTHQNSQFQIGDWVNTGITTFGRTPAFDAAQQITGTKHTRTFFTRCAAVASYFPSSLRFPKLSFHTYEVLKRFPVSFLETFIPSVAESGRSCAQILALAVERYGSDPTRPKRLGKFHAVRLPVKLFHSLAVRASSPDKTHLLIVQILESYLAAAQSAGNSAPGACPSDGNDVQSATTQAEAAVVLEKRPTYEERRREQCVAAARAAAQKANDPAAEKKPWVKAQTYKSKVQIVWTRCTGPDKDFVDTENGPVRVPKKMRSGDTFRTLEKALAAAKEYSEDRGYIVAPFSCPLHGRPSWHLRAAAEIDLSKEQAEIRVQVEDFIQSTRASLRQQHAQA